MENGWTEHIEALVSANAAMRDNIAQKQLLIDKLVAENAELTAAFRSPPGLDYATTLKYVNFRDKGGEK